MDLLNEINGFVSPICRFSSTYLTFSLIHFGGFGWESGRLRLLWLSCRHVAFGFSTRKNPQNAKRAMTSNSYACADANESNHD